MKHHGLLAVGIMAVMWSLPVQAHAAAVIAGSIVRDIGPLAVAIQSVLIIVAAIIVAGLGINASMDFRRGDMAGGVYGVFTTILAAVVLFVIIPALIGGSVAAASVLH